MWNYFLVFIVNAQIFVINKKNIVLRLHIKFYCRVFQLPYSTCFFNCFEYKLNRMIFRKLYFILTVRMISTESNICKINLHRTIIAIWIKIEGYGKKPWRTLISDYYFGPTLTLCMYIEWPYFPLCRRFFVVLRSGKTFGITHDRRRPIWHLSRKYVRLGFPIGFSSFAGALLYFGIFVPDKGSAALRRRQAKKSEKICIKIREIFRNAIAWK